MSKTLYFSQLDGLRFLAVLAVMIQHWVTNYIGIALPFGYTGVTLFFVLSGFLITRILVLSIDALPANGKVFRNYFLDFYKRRCLRIFPLYFLVVALLYLFDCGNVRNDIWWLVSHAVNIKFAIQGRYDPWITHLWSLSIEEQYYLIFPLLIFLTRKEYYVHLLFGLIIFSLVTKVLFLESGLNYRSIGFITTSAFDAFGLGGLLAYLFVYQTDSFKKLILSRKFFAGLLALLAIALYFRVNYGEAGSYQVVWFRLLVSLFSFWLIGRAVLGFDGVVGSFLDNRWISYLGKISYGLYVYHYFVHSMFSDVFGEEVSLQPHMAPLYFVLTVLISAVSWEYYEKPINNMKYQPARVSAMG